MSLEDNDNKQRQEPNEEIDRFSIFMFGNNRHRETYKEGEYNNNSPEMPEQKEQSSFDSTTNLFDNWFFGSRRKGPETSTSTTQNQIENLLNNVDVDLLMETIDMFVATSEQFKPLFKEITPFINRFSKKFKSNKDA
jgi:hypothetical protein